jgi:hypothetical protein
MHPPLSGLQPLPPSFALSHMPAPHMGQCCTLLPPSFAHACEGRIPRLGLFLRLFISCPTVVGSLALSPPRRCSCTLCAYPTIHHGGFPLFPLTCQFEATAAPPMPHQLSPGAVEAFGANTGPTGIAVRSLVFLSLYTILPSPLHPGPHICVLCRPVPEAPPVPPSMRLYICLCSVAKVYL